MPLPVLPLVIGGAGVALLLAGNKSATPAAPSGPSGTSATPTQATTGGANGGATTPSHADTVNTSKESPTVDGQTGGAATPGNGGSGGADSTPGHSSFSDRFSIGEESPPVKSPTTVTTPDQLAGDIIKGAQSYQDAKDPWGGGPSGKTPQGADSIAQIGGLTGAAVADTFETIWGGTLGGIW